MTQLIVTLEDNTLTSSIKKAISLIRGVVQVKEQETAAVSHEPNAETIEAINECRSGHYAGTVDTSSVKAMMKSILG